ncbi:MAG: ParB/RepB/Spo0J family partition protein [Xanthobacteraceae bacterium]|nr:ParB/RepB/Spo0J family partition protein [Xanthobacteraceae bacterium]
MAEDGRSRLGRGLAALIGDVGDETKVVERGRGARKAPIEFVKANPRNPRRNFSDEELGELADSIRQRGIIQPIVVRAIKGTSDQFEIVAGERRWRAAQRAGLHEVPIITVEVSDAEALELAIIENVQRADLNPLEEAMGYQSLIDQYKHSQGDVARFVGKSRSHVANTLRLMQLPDSVKALINSGQLTAGHARALVGQPNADALARDIVNRGLNVRQVEALTQAKDGKPQAKAGKGKSRKDADTMALERRVSDALGLNVTIEHRGKGGVVHIAYGDLEQMEEVLRRLERS